MFRFVAPVFAILAAFPAKAMAQDAYIGEIRMIAGGYCPQGYAEAQGQLLPIAQHDALFALLGTSFGGNGTVHFALPKLAPLVSANGAGVLYCIALQGFFPPRN